MEAIIFGVLIVAWVAYLVPWFVMRRHDEIEESEETSEFPDSMAVVRDGGLTITPASAEAVDDAAADGTEVATPYTRAHARHELRQAWADAAVRRRRTLAVLMLLTTAMAVLAGLNVLSWWFTVGAGALVVLFLVVARFSVVTMARRFDDQVEQINRGWDEHTVLLTREDPFPGSAGDVEQREEDEPTTAHSVTLSGPIAGDPGSLWDAVPVTAPTYVSTPIAARTVRTIDLTAPGPVAGETDSPVTAEDPQAEDLQAVEDTADGAVVDAAEDGALEQRTA
ncbi:MAG: hypothetical protein LKI24_12090 [Acidipropionibacterium sp.]|nr:hypothetical protein [Acidipropionibacterium sp.]